MRLIVLAALSAIPTFVQAQNCAAITDPARRLACFDASAKANKAPASPRGARTGSPAAGRLRYPERPAPGSHTARVAVDYDRFRDASSVTADIGPIPALNGGGPLALTAFASANGKDVTAAQSVTLLILVSGTDWQYLDCHDVSLLADDQRVRITTQARSGKVVKGGVIESITAEIPLAAFLPALKAMKLEGKLCRTLFAIEGPAMSALRDLASRLNPAAR